MPELYLVHCGFYDPEVGDGIYESHTNLFVAAASFEDAKIQAKQLDEFRAKRMHVDGIQHIIAVQGWRLNLTADTEARQQTRIASHKHRDLAPKP